MLDRVVHVHGDGLAGDVVEIACLSDPVVVPSRRSDSQWHEIETIPLLSRRSILHVDFESGRCARSLQQGVLGTVPVVTALDPFCHGRIIEGIILEFDLGDGPCRVLLGVATDKIFSLRKVLRPKFWI